MFVIRLYKDFYLKVNYYIDLKKTNDDGLIRVTRFWWGPQYKTLLSSIGCKKSPQTQTYKVKKTAERVVREKLLKYFPDAEVESL